VGKYARRGMILQGAHRDLPGVDGCAIQGTEKQVLATQYPVLAVQKQAAEYLPLQAPEVVLQEPTGLGRAGQHVSIAQLLQCLRSLPSGTDLAALVEGGLVAWLKLLEDQIYDQLEGAEDSAADGDEAGDAVAQADEACERRIREWFDWKLISPSGIRDVVQRAKDQSDGLPNELIEDLCETHLVRAEERGGVTWYELAHDRLIDPVRQSNRRWREKHLQPFQRQAFNWNREKRPPRLLLRGKELEKALRWEREHPDFVPIHRYLASFYREEGRDEDAERTDARLAELLGASG